MSAEGRSAAIAARPAVIPLSMLLGLLAAGSVLAYAMLMAGTWQLPLPPATALGVFAAAAISSVAGFAFSALCGPVLAFSGFEPVQLVQTLMLCSIAIQGWSVVALRREFDPRALLPLLAGGLCALPLGVMALLTLPSALHAKPVGGLILAYGIWALLSPPVRLRQQHGWKSDFMVGATGGITGGLAAFPGAVVAVWCGVRGWPKGKQRAVTQSYILLMQIVALGMIMAMAPTAGLSSIPDPAILLYLPPALVGTAFGLHIFKRLTDRQFGRVVSLLLVLGGLAMLMAPVKSLDSAAASTNAGGVDNRRPGRLVAA